MKILLVKPQVYLKVAKSFHGVLHLEPLEMEIVAGGIAPEHDVQILDLTLAKKPFKTFSAKLAAYQPDIVGIGGYSNQSENMKELARLTKAANSKTLVVAGGVHATIVPQKLKLPELFDVIVRGDGAANMGEIVDAWAKDKSLPDTDYILTTKAPDFDERATKPPAPLQRSSIDTAPRRDLVNRSDYFCVCSGESNTKLKTLFPQVASMRTSVGCPHRCRFCVVHFLANGKYLQRTPEDVVDEIAGIKEDYIYFVDDEMFISPKRVAEIARLLKERGIQKKYISWARADTICKHPEIFKDWKEVGLETVYVGLESLEEDQLESYNKGVDPGMNKKAVEILRELDIGLHAALIVDPDYVAEDFIKLRKTIDFVSPAEVTFTVFSPSPGTPLFDEHDGEYVCDPYLHYDCMHTILPTKLPLKTFYRYFSLLYLFGFRKNPWRMKKIKVPFRDFIRVMLAGAKCGWHLKHIYKDYPKDMW